MIAASQLCPTPWQTKILMEESYNDLLVLLLPRDTRSAINSSFAYRQKRGCAGEIANLTWDRVLNPATYFFNSLLALFLRPLNFQRFKSGRSSSPDRSSDIIAWRERKMLKESGNWTEFRNRFAGLMEVDLHFGRRDFGTGHEEVMSDVEDLVKASLAKAQDTGRPYVMFIHGWSTSKPGQTTARSVVRKFMRSKQATPFINRSECIVHPTVFIAKLRTRT